MRATATKFFNTITRADFIAATFRYRVTTDDAAKTVGLIYIIRQGPQDFVRQVLVSGLDVTRPSIVEKSLSGIKDGDPISTVKMGEISKRLSDLGVFANVS